MIKRLIKKILWGKDKNTTNYRNYSEYVNHMRIFQEITQRNPIDLNVLEMISHADSVGLLIPSTQDKDLWHNIWPLLKNKKVLFTDFTNWDQADIYLVSGIGRGMIAYLERINYMQSPMYVIDETYIKSVMPFSKSKDPTINRNLFNSISQFVDSRGLHFYPGITTQLEEKLNSNVSITDEQKSRSNNLIEIIVANKLSKYNCQPIIEPELPSNDKRNVLVVDQAYRDFSVVLSGGIDETFTCMLESAIEENPNCNIIIKTHVDKTSNATYYSRIKTPDNVYVYNDEINPMTLIKKMDKVYCYSSTLGWEALLMNKEVHVFGSPIYAGWGLTNDRRSFTHRRTKKRSLTEIFHYVYIEQSFYVNPKNKTICEIEEALDCLIELRNRFFTSVTGN